MHWRRKWQPTPVFLPGESQGQGSLVGCCLWGRTESDTTEVTQQQQYYCKKFSEADVIVLAAPYWDLMFPAKVRAYLEEITVAGITFQYNEDGIPQGLCKAKRLIYVTTTGGPIIYNFGFEYVKALAQSFFGISDVRMFKAEGLDIQGADVKQIMERAKSEIIA